MNQTRHGNLTELPIIYDRLAEKMFGQVNFIQA